MGPIEAWLAARKDTRYTANRGDIDKIVPPPKRPTLCSRGRGRASLYARHGGQFPASSAILRVSWLLSQQ